MLRLEKKLGVFGEHCRTVEKCSCYVSVKIKYNHCHFDLAFSGDGGRGSPEWGLSGNLALFSAAESRMGLMLALLAKPVRAVLFSLT